MIYVVLDQEGKPVTNNCGGWVLVPEEGVNLDRLIKMYPNFNKLEPIDTVKQKFSERKFKISNPTDK